MDAQDIVIGGVYSNGKGSTRKVIGDADSRKPGATKDALQYVVLTGRNAGNEYTMTRAALARWATERMPDGTTTAEDGSPDGGA